MINSNRNENDSMPIASTPLNSTLLSRRLMFTSSIKCVRMELILHSMNAFHKYTFAFTVDTNSLLFEFDSVVQFIRFVYVLKLVK